MFPYHLLGSSPALSTFYTNPTNQSKLTRWTFRFRPLTDHELHLPSFHYKSFRNGRKFRGKITLSAILFLFGFLCLLAINLTPFDSGSTYASPVLPSNGIKDIVTSWNGPRKANAGLSSWPKGFSRNISPIPCHSHNDYERRVPLYDALLVGCTGVEADVWLTDNNDNNPELLVGHTLRSLRPERTLKSLYIDPLVEILEHQNSFPRTSNETEIPVGVFEMNPKATLTLLIDFKTDGAKLWPLVQQQLEPLRRRGWLTHWTNTTGSVVQRPITIVATGNAVFEDVIANSTHRDIFFDAPLNEISDEKYTVENSFYASVKMQKATGIVWLGGFTSSQLKQVQEQTRQATEKGLRARYWSTPKWPVFLRNRVWGDLVDSGVGMLNVDDMMGALALFGGLTYRVEEL